LGKRGGVSAQKEKKRFQDKNKKTTPHDTEDKAPHKLLEIYRRGEKDERDWN